MKKTATLLAFVLLVLFIAAGCGKKKSETSANNQQTPSVIADTIIKDVPANTPDQSIVRNGVIDLASIDHNHDGKVYECPMDYNVVDDKANTCPECKMDLEEVTIVKAKANLNGADFRVK